MAVRAVVTDDSFDITLTGWDRAVSFRSRLTVPLSAVTGVGVVGRRDAVGQLRWRLGGTFVPGVVAAGNYSLRDRDGRAFVCVYRADEILQVSTNLWRPREILLQHPDRHDLAWLIGERIG